MYINVKEIQHQLINEFNFYKKKLYKLNFEKETTLFDNIKYILTQPLKFIESELYYYLKDEYEFIKKYCHKSKELFVLNLNQEVKFVIENDRFLYVTIAENDDIYYDSVCIDDYESQEDLINDVIFEFSNKIKDPEKIYLEYNMYMKYYILVVLSEYMEEKEFNRQFCFLLKQIHDFDASLCFLEHKLIYHMKKYRLIR